MKTVARVYSHHGYSIKVLIPLPPTEVKRKVEGQCKERGFELVSEIDWYEYPTKKEIEIRTSDIYDETIVFSSNKVEGDKALGEILWSLVPLHDFFMDIDKLHKLSNYAVRTITNRWEYKPKAVFTLDKAFELSGGYIVRNEDYGYITDIHLPSVAIDKSLWRKLPKNVNLNVITGEWSLTGNIDIDKVLAKTFTELLSKL